MPGKIFSLFISCLLTFNSYSATNKTDFTDLSQVCFLNNTASFSFYSLYTSTVFLINDDSHRATDFIYALQKQSDHSHFSNTQNIIEFNLNSAAIKINNEDYHSKKHDLKKIISCDFISSIGKPEAEYIQKILSNYYDVHLELIVDEKTNTLLESKTNTQQAINRLSEKYNDDPKMLGYMDKFLIRGGLIDNESTLISALENNKKNGIVFKVPKGCAGFGVLIVSVEEIKAILKGYNAKLTPKEYLRPVKHHKEVFNHLIHRKQLAWQEFISPHDYTEDRALQFTLNKTITPFFTVSGTMVPPFYLGDYYEGETIKSVFDDLTPEENNYFNKILRELLDEKAKLGGKNIAGILDEKIQLKSFDSSAFMMKDKNRIYPKIYEFNARLPAAASLIESEPFNISKKPYPGQGYFWLMTPYVSIPQNVPAKQIAKILTKTLTEFRNRHPKHQIDIRRTVFPNDVSRIQTYIDIRPADQSKKAFWLNETLEFSKLLDKNIHRYKT